MTEQFNEHASKCIDVHTLIDLPSLSTVDQDEDFVVDVSVFLVKTLMSTRKGERDSMWCA